MITIFFISTQKESKYMANTLYTIFLHHHLPFHPETNIPDGMGYSIDIYCCVLISIELAVARQDRLPTLAAIYAWVFTVMASFMGQLYVCETRQTQNISKF